MNTTINLVVFLLALSGAFAQEPAAALRMPPIVAETVISGPYKRATVAGEIPRGALRGLRATGGYINSEHRNLGGTITVGYVLRPIKTEETELSIEPQFGGAFGPHGTNFTIFGQRTSLESEKWSVESWVQRFGGKLNFVTGEPVAEVGYHVCKGIHLGVTSSIYFGLPNEKVEHIAVPQTEHEKSRAAQAEEQPAAEHLLFVGPTIFYKMGPLTVGSSYEMSLRHGNFAAVFASYTFGRH